MKLCNKCNIERNEIDFVFRNKEKGVRQNVCNVCQREYKLKHYYNNKEQYYRRNEKTEKRLVDLIKSFKKACIVCEEKELCCIDFHHLDPSQKEFNIAELAKYGSKTKIEKEIIKCVCLCSNCHRKLHAGIIKLK